MSRPQGPIASISSLPDFKDRMNDKDFCKRLYGSITNTDWYFTNPHMSKEDKVMEKLRGDKLCFSPSFRGAAGIIADVRNSLFIVRESYMDWYLSSPAGFVDEEIEELFNKFGWHRLVEDSDTGG